MSFKDDMKVYQDVNGYSNPYPVDTSKGRQCDNATMFSSEYTIILNKLKESRIIDEQEYIHLIDKASIVPGLTVRYSGDNTVDAPDNIIAILAASKVTGISMGASKWFWYGLKNLGFYNTSNPNHIKNTDGSMNWASFQWRQPQLIFAALCAANSHRWWKAYHLPLALWTVGTILISCLNTPPSDTNSRRLAWLLIHATKDDSLLCRLASKVWLKRLLKDYTNGYKDVCSIYYNPKGNNPYANYMPKDGWLS